MIIAGRRIGLDQPPFIVAELSSNHAGYQARAIMAIHEAKRAGCDAIKFQLYDPDRLAAERGGGSCKVPGPWMGRPLVDLYREAHTPRDWFPVLFETAREVGIIPFSSVFNPLGVVDLASLDCPAYKISSFEAKDKNLINACLATGKPVLVSNGLGLSAATPRFHVMQCVSRYPAQPEDYALGHDAYSDHTLDDTLAIAAVATGAVLIEKHFMPDYDVPSPDDHFSIGPTEMASLVRRCRAVWAMRQRREHAKPGEGLGEMGTMRL